MEEIVGYVVSTVGDFGYIGIFIMMFLESSFFPFPSEVVMIPAGYLASKEEMNILAVVLFGIFGSLVGALFNYFLAVKYGRGFLIKFGKYLFFTEESLIKVEKYFKNHGHISTFVGRLIPAVRQYISFPAGLAKMNLMQFSIYTSLGAGIWVIILTLLGFYIGENEALIKEYMRVIIVSILIFLALLSSIYYFNFKRKKRDI